MWQAYLVGVDPEFAEDVGGAADKSYGALVRHVLPKPLVGFFAAVVVGSILSTFNSVLNSSATLFSLDVYKNFSTERRRWGKWCGRDRFAVLSWPCWR